MCVFTAAVKVNKVQQNNSLEKKIFRGSIKFGKSEEERLRGET